MYISLIPAFLALDMEEVLVHDDFQESLMFRFFQNISREKMPFLQYENISFCDRVIGVTCTDRKVTKIDYSLLDSGNFSIEFVPHSVCDLCIIRSGQCYPIETRYFAQCAERIRLPGNRIYGSVNLQTLPQDLRDLDLNRNSIVGPIILTRLPKTLESLRLSTNHIQQKALFFTDFPENLMVYLQGIDHRIGQFCKMHENGAVEVVRGNKLKSYRILY